MKRTSMRKIREIIRLFMTTDLSLRKISQALNLSRPVVSNYYNGFKDSGMSFEEIIKLNDDDLLLII